MLCAFGFAPLRDDITDALDTCERSLQVSQVSDFTKIDFCRADLRNDYLEQKKKSFPRFYFVANGALLDILSNGNKPLKAL